MLAMDQTSPLFQSTLATSSGSDRPLGTQWVADLQSMVIGLARKTKIKPDFLHTVTQRQSNKVTAALTPRLPHTVSPIHTT